MLVKSFNKMVKQKRIKICTYILALVFLICVYGSDSTKVPDLIHVIKQSGSVKESLCIAGGDDTNLGIDWTYPIPTKKENLPVSESSFMPQINNEFNCNFEKQCNSWKINKWYIPSLNYESILDTRWEDFRAYLTTNQTNILENRIDIPHEFNLGISIRSGNDTQVWVCEGWNPELYPCYVLSMGGLTNWVNISLSKNGKEEKLHQSKQDLNNFSEDEWKNFKISYTKYGKLELTELSKNILLLNYTDDNPLKPLYLLMKSISPTLWKVHKNNYLSTNISSTEKFGPPLNATNSNICISVYVSMCFNCSMKIFLLNNNTEEVLADVDGKDLSDFKWKEIKLMKYNNTEDFLQIYVETKSTDKDKYWAIDNVRLCTKTEIKITKLSIVSKNQDFDILSPQMSCHFLQYPQWRPPKEVVPYYPDMPIVRFAMYPTSIKLDWLPESSGKTDIKRYLAFKYEGMDLCTGEKDNNKNFKRLKSNGWILTTDNEVTIDNLVPYTHYSIIFMDPVYGRSRNYSINTIGTAKLSKDELPQNITIKPRDKSVKISFDKAKCNVLYGKIIYRITFSNKNLNFSKVFVDTIDQYAVDNLSPFTNYNLTIESARDISNLSDSSLTNINYYNFTTGAAAAPAVSNLEVYETDETSISIRFDLPNKPNGIPKSARVQYCHPLYKNTCLFKIQNLTKCNLWPDKYCMTIKDLIRNYSYKLIISLKNENTSTFGTETTITTVTKDKEPGPPTNITYSVTDCNEQTDYCHLNISWLHPYNQSGVITAFDIILSEKTDNVDKVIHEVLLVQNKLYQDTYTYTIKYIPFSMKYNIRIRSLNNKYKSNFASITAKLDHMKTIVNEKPYIVNYTDTKLFVNAPTLDSRMGSYLMIIIMQNYSREEVINEEIKSLADNNICFDDRETWIACVVQITQNISTILEIGNGSTTYSSILNRTIENKALKPNNEYCINYVLKNVYKKTEHIAVYHEKHVVIKTIYSEEFVEKSPELSGAVITSILTVFIILILTGIVITYWYRNKLPCYKRRYQDGEHIYEAMPFDEYEEPSVVFNATYDKLIH